MKKSAFLSLSVLFCITLFGQTVPTEFQRSNQRMLTYGNLDDVDLRETVLSKFVEQKWSPTIVKFHNGSTLLSQVIFDQYNNKLYYLQQGVIMEFGVPVKEFTISLIQGKDSVFLLFRNGYPAVERQTDETFYEVLVDGNLQLLRCKAKTIRLHKDVDVPEEKRDYKSELFYAFLPDHRMVLVKKDKTDLMKQLPEYADKIAQLVEKNKLKLKNENDFARLFLLLN